MRLHELINEWVIRLFKISLLAIAVCATYIVLHILYGPRKPGQISTPIPGQPNKYINIRNDMHGLTESHETLHISILEPTSWFQEPREYEILTTGSTNYLNKPEDFSFVWHSKEIVSININDLTVVTINIKDRKRIPQPSENYRKSNASQ